MTSKLAEYSKEGNLPIIAADKCPGSLRAVFPTDTIKVDVGDYVTICYDCEREVHCDVLLITVSGVLMAVPRIQVHADFSES